MKTSLIATVVLALLVTGTPCHAEETAKAAPSPAAQPPKAGTPSAHAKPGPPSATPKAAPTAAVPSEWQGIPTPPAAKNGRPVLNGYSYTVPQAAQPIEDFYRAELKKKGWALAQREHTDRSKLGVPAVKLDFAREQERANIVILENAKEKTCLVVVNLRGGPQAPTEKPTAKPGAQKQKPDAQHGTADAPQDKGTGAQAK